MLKVALALTWTLLCAVSASAETVTHVTSTPAEDSWRIDEPNVKQPFTEYPQIIFIANDAVVVNAGGCVQTGGVGKTWKLYVNPQGPNSGSFYHGLIQFPAASLPGSLVRIGTIIGQTFFIPSTSPGGDLKLGYEDDDYSDNGYWSHDDGTGDQCKGIGSAFVTIDIHHGSSPPAPQPGNQPPFNLVWNSSDDSGFPIGAIWASQVNDITKVPDPSSCETKPQNFSDPSCSTQSPRIDLPTGWNKFICSFTGTAINGHVNWFPVTYIGNIQWSDHSGNDDDYNFNFSAIGGEADVTSNMKDNGFGVLEGALGLEFDSDETIDHFHTNWWNEFHDAVDSSDTLAKALVVPTTSAVVTGLLDLDCDHTCRTEMHPVYNLAMPVFDPSDHTGLGGEVWAMFMRNYGNEGYCSSQDHDLQLSTLTIRIPWNQGASDVKILNKPDNSDNFFRVSDPTIIGPEITVAKGDGILVQFEVPAGLKHAMAYGELHLNWVETPQSAQIVLRNRAAAAARQKRLGDAREDEGEAGVQRLYDRLPPAVRNAARHWTKTPFNLGDYRARPSRPPRVVATLPKLVRRPPPRDLIASAPIKASNDRARAVALCNAYPQAGELKPPTGCRLFAAKPIDEVHH